MNRVPNPRHGPPRWRLLIANALDRIRASGAQVGSVAKKVSEWFGGQGAPLHRWLLKPKNRPVIVLVAVILLAHTWTVSLFATLERASATRWFQNHLTYSLVHWTTFAWAVSIATIAFDPKKYSRTLDRRKWEVASYTFLGFGIFIATCAVIDDFLGNRPEPYMLKKAVAATHAENELRQHYDRLQPERKGVNPAKRAEYEGLLNSYNERFYSFKREDTWRYINALGYVTLFLTWFFSMLMVFLAWDIAVALPITKRRINENGVALKELNVGLTEFIEMKKELEESKTEFKRALEEAFKGYVLVVAWIPFRVYVTWYQNYYLLNGKIVYPGVVLLTILAVVFLTILMVLKQGPDVLKKLGTVYAVLVGAIGLISRFKPEILEELLGALKELLNAGISFFLILCAAVFGFAFTVYMVSTGEGEDNEGRDDPNQGIRVEIKPPDS